VILNARNRAKGYVMSNINFGKIHYFNPAKNYGFIEVYTRKSPLEAASREEFFFHGSNMRNHETPGIGAYVTFAIAPGLPGKRPQAVSVRFATVEEVQRTLKTAEVADAGANALKAVIS
jgi:cold shock CspA family protein